MRHVGHRRNAEESSSLTPRESEAVSLAASGATDKEIAFSMGITYESAKEYMLRARRKTGSRNRVEITIWWLREEKGQPA